LLFVQIVEILLRLSVEIQTLQLGLQHIRALLNAFGDVFGGTITSKSFKALDSHIGCIYGDSITPERCETILNLLEKKGFSSGNIVFGIGSYTYQYVTRDTFGFAMKATWVQIDGKGIDIFKKPITDNGMKNSAKGRLAVLQTESGLKLVVKQPKNKKTKVSFNQFGRMVSLLSTNSSKQLEKGL